MSVIDEVKDRLDIVEVISSYVPLQKSGRNYKALCPFHSEKTPSFVVFPDNQRWHCFGACGDGGDVFTFVMKREGWDFRTALEELARRAGVELRPRTPAQVQAEEEADRLRGALTTAAQYYNHLLHHSPEAEAARAYVARRGLDDETIERFLLGYSLPGWERTRTYLTGHGYTVEELSQAGLLVQREDGSSTYDRFRERLMIPIRDAQGRVTGFGARTLDPEGVPKYLNSPQTALFDKSHMLFGLDLARQAIRREDQVVIVEGYMDVMQAHQAGFANVVAQMGTALTEPQLEQLQRYTKRFVLALDPDAAGVQATLRGVEVARDVLEQEWEPVFDPRGLVGYEARLGAEIRILRLPGDQDPDDLIRKDPQRWATLVEEAVSVMDFYLQILLEGLDLDDTKAKAHVVDVLLPVLRAVANPVEREDYVQKMARALRVDALAVLARLRSAGHQTARVRRGAARTQDRAPQMVVEADLESHCLSSFLQRTGLLSQVNEALEEGQLEPLRGQDFQDAGCRAIFEAWDALLAAGHPNSFEMLYAQLPTDLYAQLDGLLALDQVALADEQLVRDVVLTLLRLRERNLKRLGQELSFLTIEAREAGDMRAEQYVEALRTYKETLLRTQQALAQRWSLVGRG
ncbi:MAG: DNA primase [Chloroflexota bacterium]|nr:DNA primase [Chloroflexota bacterium]